MGKFENFLLNEDNRYLGQKVGDVLTSVQDLQDDINNLGSRHLSRLATEIVNEIRKIIHSRWKPEQSKHLKELQKVAVALQKTIDERGDLKEIIPAAAQALQDLSGKLGVRVNNLSGPEEMAGQSIGQQDFQLTGDGPMPQQQPPPGMQPPQPQVSMQPPVQSQGQMPYSG